VQQGRDAAKKAGRAEAANAAGVETGAARAQLARVLASAAFDASERNRRFVRYVVEETLAGRGDRIKAYDIAVTVFGRDDSFDPQSDPIVRIEASRLRRSLERYYLLAGGDDPVRIEIPKGAYVPAFRWHANADGVPDSVASAASRRSNGGEEEPGRSQAPDTADAVHYAKAPLAPEPPPATDPWRWFPRPKPASPRTVLLGVALVGAIALGSLVSAIGGMWFDESAQSSDDAVPPLALQQGPAILVSPFEDDDVEPDHAHLRRGFTREIIRGLTRFSDLFVFGPETAMAYESTAVSPEMAAELGLDYIVAGGITVSDRFRVTASLIDARTGQYLWSGKFDANLTAAEIIKVRDDLADQVVRELARPYGVIFATESREVRSKPPESLTAYECVLQFQQYWRRYDAALYGQVRECLERAVVAEPEYADALASLALIHANAYRFDLAQGPAASDAMGRALELARRAVDLAPDSTRGYQALHLVYWLMNDVERSLEAAERGFALNPNDTEIMADLGLRYCMRAQWAKGLPLVEQAFHRNPAQPGQYRVATFLHHYIHGRYGEALTEAKKIEAPGVIYNHIALAMAYARLDLTEQAAAEVGRIVAIDPAYGDRVIADLRKRNLHPNLIRVVVDGLEKAGLAAEASPRRAGS